MATAEACLRSAELDRRAAILRPAAWSLETREWAVGRVADLAERDRDMGRLISDEVEMLVRGLVIFLHSNECNDGANESWIDH
jgi:hypothetical protein